MTTGGFDLDGQLRKELSERVEVARGRAVHITELRRSYEKAAARPWLPGPPGYQRNPFPDGWPHLGPDDDI
jgi:hypothetical protein